MESNYNGQFPQWLAKFAGSGRRISGREGIIGVATMTSDPCVSGMKHALSTVEIKVGEKNVSR
jgi:hypothetical protein